MKQQPRDRPVPGRTLRQLLNLGFISEEEQANWLAMDIEQLQLYDERSCCYPSHGYPGNGIPVNNIPTPQMRAKWLKNSHLFVDGVV